MIVGNKAASLIQMRELDLPVPDFFVIPTQFFRAYRANKENLLPKEVKELLDVSFDPNHKGTWAVRSSSTKEDSQNYSFAGLFESYLGLSSLADVENAIIKCWDCVESERVKTYAKKHSIDPAEIEMAIVVQKFIEPDYAGVLFTAHPLTANDQEMYIELCKGRGENLVAGHVTPDQICLNWMGPVRILEHQKNSDVVVTMPVLEKLQELAQTLQAHYGCPQDIEFAVKDSQVFIVQSRPITKLQFADNGEEWTTADFRDGGVSSDVVSPLMWSLYDKIFSASLPEYFFKIKLVTREFIQNTLWYRVFYGRPYWNLNAVKDIMSQVPEFNEKNFDEDMSIPITYEGSGRTTPVTLLGVLKVLPTAFALNSEFKRQMKRSQGLLKNFYQIEKFYKGLSISKLKDSDLHAALKKLIHHDYTFVESEYFQTIYNASNAKMELLSPLKKLQKIDSSLEYIKLISDLGTLEATLPAFELAKLAQSHNSPENIDAINKVLLQSFERVQATHLTHLSADLRLDLIDFASRFYYHSEREMDLRVPRWGEDLTFILKTLLQIFSANRTFTPEKSQKAQGYSAELAKLKAAYNKSLSRWIPGSWKSLIGKLNRVREFLRLREEIRCHSTKMYYFIRIISLEVARRKLPVSQESMVFYAHYEQVLSLIEGTMAPAEFLWHASQVKKYADGFRNYKNPNEIGYRYNFIGKKLQLSASEGNKLKGIGCSAGVVKAKARVVHNIAEAASLRAGEILVTRFTDPGWTPLFSLASGVVCENGGLLSHAALISREYGIPSVLNVKDATSLIKTGQEIELDGLKGEVSLL